MKSWRELGIDVDEMDAGTRASMDGQVRQLTTNYAQWLERQPYERQIKVLGDDPRQAAARRGHEARRILLR